MAKDSDPARRRRLRSYPLASLMAVALVVAAGTQPTSLQSRRASSSKLPPVTLTWYFEYDYGANYITQSGGARVFAAANKIIKAKLNATVKFKPIFDADYVPKMTAIVGSHQAFDLLDSFPFSYLTNATAGAFYPLNKLIKKYGKAYTSVVGKAVEQSVAVNGKIYAMVGQQDDVIQPVWQVQKRFAKAAGLKVSGGNVVLSGPNKYKPDDIASLLAKIKASPQAKAKDFIPLHNYNNTYDPLAYGYWPIGPSAYNMAQPFFVKMGTTKVTLGLQPQEQYAELMRTWYKKGYIPGDAGTAEDVSLLPSQIAVGYTPEGGFQAGQPPPGSPEGYYYDDVPMLPRPVFLGETGGISVSSTSKHPARAVMLLNLLNKNKTLMNLLTYGIKGVNYTVKDGVANVNEHAGYVGGCYFFGNCLLTYPLAPYTGDYWSTQVKKWNKEAFVSPLSGFSFNDAPVESDWEQIATVTAQYYQPLFTGSVPVQKEFAQYVAGLKAAGAETVLKEIQKQLNSYLKTHPAAKKALLSDTYAKLIKGPEAPAATLSFGS